MIQIRQGGLTFNWDISEGKVYARVNHSFANLDTIELPPSARLEEVHEAIEKYLRGRNIGTSYIQRRPTHYLEIEELLKGK